MIVPAIGTSGDWDGSIILGCTYSKTNVVIDIDELILAEARKTIGLLLRPAV